MSLSCVIGLQWGDEGKGKIVDLLANRAHLVVRYQGGGNAGHTIVLNNQKFVFHHIPTGILHQRVRCVIGNGTVIDPARLLKEIQGLKKYGIKAQNRLSISERTHLVMPYHRLLDSLSEQLRGKNKIGTTDLGIGPCYADKFARTGIRILELYQPNLFKVRLEENLKVKNLLLKKLSNFKPLSVNSIYREYMAYAKKLAPYVTDTRILLNQALKARQNILFEGAQGTLLNIDWGTYPFVTSSHSDFTGLAAGCGIPTRKVDQVIGVLKAYTTRVGSGPFPTELHDILGMQLRTNGGEFGATTGRPRRCGWLDLVSAKYTTEINDADALAITKLDVLSGLEKIRVCVAYRYRGKVLKDFPASLDALQHCRPVYKDFPGWHDDISQLRKYAQLPPRAKKYLNFIQKTLGVKITMISVGKNRHQIIYV